MDAARAPVRFRQLFQNYVSLAGALIAGVAFGTNIFLILVDMLVPSHNPYVGIVQLLWGFAVKRLPALAKWPNKLIPVFNFVLAFLANVAVPQPAHAGVLAMPIAAIHLPGFLAVAVHAAWTAFLQTLVVTGLHSSLKNVGQHAATI